MDGEEACVIAPPLVPRCAAAAPLRSGLAWSTARPGPGACPTCGVSPQGWGSAWGHVHGAWRGPAGVVPSLPPLGRRGAVAVALTAGVSDGTRGAACLLYADGRQGYRREDGGRREAGCGEGE